MEKVKTYHLMVLDRSGSMMKVKDETVSGLNQQLQSIRTTEEEHDDQEQFVCFVTFASDIEHDQIWNKSINDVPDLAESDYTPGAYTALYDAIGIGINKLRDEIRDDLEDRKVNVIVTILTDGFENDSKEYTGTSIKDLIEEVQATGQWTIAFLGCSGDVFAQAQAMGIRAGNTMCYSAGSEGTTEAFTSMAVSSLSQ